MVGEEDEGVLVRVNDAQGGRSGGHAKIGRRGGGHASERGRTRAKTEKEENEEGLVVDAAGRSWSYVCFVLVGHLSATSRSPHRERARSVDEGFGRHFFDGRVIGCYDDWRTGLTAKRANGEGEP